MSIEVAERGASRWSVVPCGGPGASIEGAWSVASWFVKYAFCVFESGIDVECACPDLRVEGCDFLEEIVWRVPGLVASVGIGDPCFVEALDF